MPQCQILLGADANLSSSKVQTLSMYSIISPASVLPGTCTHRCELHIIQSQWQLTCDRGCRWRYQIVWYVKTFLNLKLATYITVLFVQYHLDLPASM